MALLDVLAQFTADAGDSVAAAAGTANLSNQYDTALAGRNIGAGHPIYLVIIVSTAIVTGGSAGSIRFQLASDDSATISTTTQSIHYCTPDYVTDDDPTIPAGTVLFNCPIPSAVNYVSRSVALAYVTTGPGAPYERYVGLQRIITTTTITAGAVKAFLTHDQAFAWKAYPVAAH